MAPDRQGGGWSAMARRCRGRFYNMLMGIGEVMGRLGLSSYIVFGAMFCVWLAADGPASPPVKFPVGQVIRDCPDCPEMVAIPQIGHGLSNPGHIFFIGQHEITWKEFIPSIEEGTCPPPQILPSRPKPWPPLSTYPFIKDNHPLTLVTPLEFECYLAWLSKKSGHIYRLPSTAEWEHAARAGAATRFPWGDEIGFDHAAITVDPANGSSEQVYDANRLMKKNGLSEPKGMSYGDVRWTSGAKYIWPVASFAPNAWGLYDVMGNVEEVTTDVSEECQLPMFKNKPCRFIATGGPTFIPVEKVHDPSYTPFKVHGITTANNRSDYVGFRVVRD